MKKTSKAICSLMSLIVFAQPLHALPLNSTAISQCELAFYACVNASEPFSNCTTPFEDCISTTGFLQRKKSQECFLAESAWQNLKISAGFSVAIFIFSTLIIPAGLKVMAKKITKWSTYDRQQHPCLGWLGPKLLYMTDGDGDGIVTASELITPQTIFSFSSVAIPIYQWFTANDAQARCDYQESLVVSPESR